MRLDPDIDRITWDIALMSRPAALQQDWSYGEAVTALGGEVRRVGILDGNTLVGLAQFTTRRIGGVVQMAAAVAGIIFVGLDVRVACCTRAESSNSWLVARAPRAGKIYSSGS